MPKRSDVKKVLIIGSGPIVIGQAAEFDYAGTQACLSLKEEGYEVILVNSNPATIMTDVKMADKVYMEPLTLEYVARIIRYERPDAIIPGLGGQTGLNLGMQLARKGILKECNVKLLGTSLDAIEKAEDREKFKELCESIGEPVIASKITYSMKEAIEAAKEIGYPVVLRPAFTLGGTGGGFAENEKELKEVMKNALALSPVKQVLVEKSVKGYKEIEFEVMRDSGDNAITICGMENVDPVGIHTGDSMVVAPIQTLSNHDFNMLKESSLKIIRALKIEGGCNVQFALDPNSSKYYLIEVNPRVSRSSALASKASGYPIAKVTAKVALGLRLDEINIVGSPANLEPKMDYIATKISRFPFDKFASASNKLGTQMKATGEIMSLSKTIEEGILKGVRSMEIGACHLHLPKFDNTETKELLEYIKDGRDDRFFAIAELIRREVSLDEIFEITKITKFFLEKMKNIIDYEKVLKKNKMNLEILKEAKKIGFSDKFIGKLWDKTESEIYLFRKENNVYPAYRMINTVPEMKDRYVPYFYSTYNDKKVVYEDPNRKDKKIIVLGSGPIRIGQGVEFDYSTVHAVTTIKKAGYEAIIINNNPETVSTDFTTSDKLYFEPLTIEDIMNVIDIEKPEGIIASLGGQTPINLAGRLTKLGVKMIGTDFEAIEKAENRDSFEKVTEDLDVAKPAGEAVTSIEEGIRVAEKIGYPVLVRPSYVLGGRAMQIVGSRTALESYLKSAVEVNVDQPVLVDKYIIGRELEVDAVCDGRDVFVPGIMEHVEKTGIHSGDSISVYPTFTISESAKEKILEYTVKLGLGIGIIGLYNIQFIVDKNDDVYVIEVNPRSSRTVPFLSKATGYALADIGTLAMLGKSLKSQGIINVYPKEKKKWYVKAPVFSFNKITGIDAHLSPEMKSTGEAIGYDTTLTRALYKALQSSGVKVANYGTVFVTIADKDKEEALPLIRRFYNLGFNIEATKGTAEFLKQNGIRTRVKKKISDGSEEILDAIRQGYVNYVINTRDIDSIHQETDGFKIRRCAVENNVAMFTALDTVRVLLDVLEEITLRISTIDD